MSEDKKFSYIDAVLSKFTARFEATLENERKEYEAKCVKEREDDRP